MPSRRNTKIKRSKRRSKLSKKNKGLKRRLRSKVKKSKYLDGTKSSCSIISIDRNIIFYTNDNKVLKKIDFVDFRSLAQMMKYIKDNSVRPKIVLISAYVFENNLVPVYKNLLFDVVSSLSIGWKDNSKFIIAFEETSRSISNRCFKMILEDITDLKMKAVGRILVSEASRLYSFYIDKEIEIDVPNNSKFELLSDKLNNPFSKFKDTFKSSFNSPLDVLKIIFKENVKPEINLRVDIASPTSSSLSEQPPFLSTIRSSPKSPIRKSPRHSPKSEDIVDRILKIYVSEKGEKPPVEIDNNYIVTPYEKGVLLFHSPLIALNDIKEQQHKLTLETTKEGEGVQEGLRNIIYRGNTYNFRSIYAYGKGRNRYYMTYLPPNNYYTNEKREVVLVDEVGNPIMNITSIEVVDGNNLEYDIQLFLEALSEYLNGFSFEIEKETLFQSLEKELNFDVLLLLTFTNNYNDKFKIIKDNKSQTATLVVVEDEEYGEEILRFRYIKPTLINKSVSSSVKLRLQKPFEFIYVEPILYLKSKVVKLLPSDRNRKTKK